MTLGQGKECDMLLSIGAVTDNALVGAFKGRRVARTTVRLKRVQNWELMRQGAPSNSTYSAV